MEYLSLTASCKEFGELKPLDFAGRSFGKFADDVPAPRGFVLAEFFEAPRGDFKLVEIQAGLEDQRGRNFLAVVLVGNAKRRCLENGGVPQQGFVDLAWCDILSTFDDQLFQPAGDEIETVSIAIAEVAGAQPAIGVDGLVGFEYKDDCWSFRIVGQRFATATNTSTTAFFIQLELNGLSKLGSNPLEILKKNISGYQPIN